MKKLSALTQQALAWAKTHRERVAAVGATAAVVIAGGVYAVLYNVRQDKQAWLQLGAAQTHAINNQRDAESQVLTDALQRYPRTQAFTYAQFMKGELLGTQGNHKEAAEVYSTLAERARPQQLRPLALLALATQLELAGELDRSIQVLNSFLQLYPDHFLTPRAYESLARVQELKGSAPAALPIYDRLTLLYPQTPFADFARWRLETLKK